MAAEPADLASTFDLLTSLIGLITKCKDGCSEKEVTQAAEALSQQVQLCREAVKRLDPMHKPIEEQSAQLDALHRTLRAKLAIARRLRLLDDAEIDAMDTT
ncbi:unnamed protein product (mitochondrion) [Plasmodiophora brassicae]|uniref:Mediator of RNA polymerase II transcription subunit 9 n=1 Tax=Plasmodiophora brassicae TaxID=37360 RepID=A0A0G4J6E3_PLABS|nr:hypothetical protein PBRA_002828 [Plasmodiophora brassicae]SPQ94965.1 unnamed protein product [Plasmodiophora brassicae]